MSNLSIPSELTRVSESEVRFGQSRAQAVIEPGIGLDQCWRMIRRHWRLIGVLISLAVIIEGTAVSLMTPEYVAKSTLLIEPEGPQLLDVKELVSAAGNTEDHDYYKTQFELLSSRDLAIRVISDLDLEHNEAFNSVGVAGRISNYVSAKLAGIIGGKAPSITSKDPAADANFDVTNLYLQGLKIEPVAGTRMVTVSYHAPDRSLAARIVDRHAHDYVKMGIELRTQAGKSAHDFLARQLLDISQRVQDSEAQLASYRHQKGIISFGVDEKNGIAAQRMTDLNKALIEVETKRVTAQAQLKLVESGDFESLPQVINNSTISGLKPAVRNLQAEYARLSASFNPGYPKLDEAKAQMGAAQKALTLEIGSIAKAVQRSYIAADAEEKRLQTEIEAETAKDLAINDASLRDAVLVREVETNSQLYKNVLQRMQEMEVTEEAPLSNISVVDNAVVPRYPSSPKKLKDIFIAILIAAMAGVGAAVYADQKDDRLRTIEEVEAFLGLPTLAMVPDFTSLGTSAPQKKTRMGTNSAQFGQSDVISEHLQRNLHDYSPRGYIAGTAETYRLIRTSLLFSRAGCPPQAIVVSSAIQGEGKTSTAANTALVFAQTGARTLLIDADLRRPNCHSLMDERNHTGLSDVLVGRLDPHEAIISTSVENLFLLTAGTAVPNPAELLTSNKMRRLIKELRTKYDVILIDTAPLMLASDTCALGTMGDGVMLVIGAHTPKTNIKRAYQRLDYVGAKVLGVVLNRVNIHESGFHEFRAYYLSYGKYESDAVQ